MTEQKDKCMQVSGLRNRCLTGPQLVSASTVKRWLQDAGPLGRVATKRLRLRLSNTCNKD